MAEKRKQKQKKEIAKEFMQTTDTFVLEKGESIFEIKGEKEKEELFLQLFQAMDVQERINFYFENFESIFASIYPDDVGYFQFVPSNKKEWNELEDDLTRVDRPK